MRGDSLSAKCANKALVPPIARQACRLDHKPKTATSATPNDQVCASRRHFVICYLSFHAFWPKRIGSSLFCIMVATWLREPWFLSRESLVQRLRTIRTQVGEFIGLPKGHFEVERSTL